MQESGSAAVEATRTIQNMLNSTPPVLSSMQASLARATAACQRIERASGSIPTWRSALPAFPSMGRAPVESPMQPK